jgi:hypothetical protein
MTPLPSGFGPKRPSWPESKNKLRVGPLQASGLAGGLTSRLLPGKDGAFFVLIAILAMSLALRSREMAQALPEAAALLLGVAYVFGSLCCAVELRAINPYWTATSPLFMWSGASDGTPVRVGDQTRRGREGQRKFAAGTRRLAGYFVVSHFGW